MNDYYYLIEENNSLKAENERLNKRMDKMTECLSKQVQHDVDFSIAILEKVIGVSQ